MRSILIALIVLLCLKSQAVASPADDAVFLANQHLNAEAVQAMRRWASRIQVSALTKPLGERNIKIRDRDRFAEMVPIEITDIAIQSYLHSGERIYLETFSPSHLDHIAEFHRSDVGVKLLAASAKKASGQMSPKSQDIVLSGILELDNSEITSLLSPTELSKYHSFATSEAGKVLNIEWESVMRRLSLALINGVLEPKLKEPKITEPYMLEVYETKGVLVFPNPIARRDSIQKLRLEIEQQ